MTKRSLALLLVFLVIASLVSCRNDYDIIQALASEVTLPHVTGFDIELAYTDSGRLKGKIYAPEVYQFVEVDEPYYEFPKGMTAVIFDSAGGSYNIHANYGIFLYQRQLWEGRNEVVINNERTGEKIETEQIYWDQKEKRIYSDKYTKITKKEGVFIGENGFEADDAFQTTRMFGYSGTMRISEERDSSSADEQP